MAACEPFTRGLPLLPSGPFHKALEQETTQRIESLLNEFIGGWSISGITNLTTGQPFTVLTNTTVVYNGFNQLVDHPNYICNGPLQVNEGNPSHLFNTGCFAPAYAGVVGSAPRNAFYGPGLIDFDATAAKRFIINDQSGFEFRSDFFNILNHTAAATTVVRA